MNYNKLSSGDIKINIYCIDIFYVFKKKGKKRKIKQKIIILTTPLTETKLSDKNITEFFIDVTYRVIPKRNDNNKLLIISCFDNETKFTYIFVL